MLNSFPPIGAPVTFREGVRKPRGWNGQVIAHDPPEDGFDAGIKVSWPTMRYLKMKGVVVFHSIPNPWLEGAV